VSSRNRAQRGIRDLDNETAFSRCMSTFRGPGSPLRCGRDDGGHNHSGPEQTLKSIITSVHEASCSVAIPLFAGFVDFVAI